MNKRNWLAVFVAAAVAFSLFAVTQFTDIAAAESDNLQYEVKGEGARLVRKVTGEVTNDVQGIPAEPVHSFLWDGNGVTDIEGEVSVEIDPEANTGEIKAEWTDSDGNEWTLEQTMFAPPPHPTGFQVGSVEIDRYVTDDPVATNVYLHGDTTAGGPVLPTIFNYMATWVPAEDTLNGEPFENPFGGPTPHWVTHIMLTAGVRDSAGQVKVLDSEGNETIYNPTLQSNEAVVDDGDLEFHVVFHDVPGPEATENFPPPLSFFYHVQFEDVSFEVKGN
ncbi:MAG: hypothetical protein R6U57_01220 [Anaerolineales bacterium]